MKDHSRAQIKAVNTVNDYVRILESAGKYNVRCRCISDRRCDAVKIGNIDLTSTLIENTPQETVDSAPYRYKTKTHTLTIALPILCPTPTINRSYPPDTLPITP
ncbi:hypothetical protein Tco_0359540 [Tanacetum coccineum]